MISTLLNIAALKLERASVVQEAFRLFQATNADFVDCFIAAMGKEIGCSHTLTFDRKASKLPEMRLLP